MTRKYILCLQTGLIIFFISVFGAKNLIAVQDTVKSYETVQEEPHQDKTTEEVKHELSPEVVHESGEVEHAEEEHGGDMSPLFFVILALLIGAMVRHFLRKVPLPYTVILLLLGLGIGALARIGFFNTWDLGFFSLDTAFMGKSIGWAGHIDPHLILYVFLPTLIFEAAFAMDVHTFKKTVTNASILAIPGLILALVLTAAIMMVLKSLGLGLELWSWQVALMFGAIVSATDPVAVVALLKELGASKKLGTLIEGESLLNDGTAIVIFMVFFAGITGVITDSSPLVDFLRVGLGGIAIGIIIAGVTIAWVKRVFNDAMVEISVVVAAAYFTFYIAEHFMHVSGVLGLVALGLVMAGVGKTRISPEVEHFLHEFWELAAFIANTLIFLIVGVVIAQRAVFTAGDFLILLIVYVGINIVRALILGLFYPIMKRSGYGVKPKELPVIWWGALRGAIGLALALIVAGATSIPQEIRDQLLFITAGIVTLTLIVNATTIKYLVSLLGLTKVAPAKALMIFSAHKYLHQSTDNSLEKFKKDRYLNRANWNVVRDFLPEDPGIKMQLDVSVETIAELRRRVLEKEKSSYWHQFKDGLIGPVAVRRLSDAISEMLDSGGTISLSNRKDLEDMWKAPGLLNKLQSVPVIGKMVENFFFERLAVSYDSARGFVEAQEEALKLVESMHRSMSPGDKEEEKNLAVIEEEINENRIHGLTFLRNLRKNYPEIYNTISTRQAIRTVLNYEKRTVERLQKNGRVDSGEAARMIQSIEERMKRLMQKPPKVRLPKTVEILKEVSWLKNIDAKTFGEVVGYFQNRVYAVGDEFLKENAIGDSLFVIVRGTAKITMNGKLIDLLGPGDTLGEMAVLTGKTSSATATAESPVTALRLRYLKIHRIMEHSESLRNALWIVAGQRIAENHLRNTEPYSRWTQNQLREMILKGHLVTGDDAKMLDVHDKVAVLITGTVREAETEKTYTSQLILEPGNYLLSEEARVYIC